MSIIFDFIILLRQNKKKNGRDYLDIAPKEQPPRKLSGKRTVQKTILERDKISPKE
jgi:hypothetical protein